MFEDLGLGGHAEIVGGRTEPRNRPDGLVDGAMVPRRAKTARYTNRRPRMPWRAAVKAERRYLGRVSIRTRGRRTRSAPAGAGQFRDRATAEPTLFDYLLLALGKAVDQLGDDTDGARQLTAGA